MTEFQKFPSIEGFHNVVKGFRPGIMDTSYNMMYAAKIKLHGTNASIRFDIEPDGIRVQPGKRTGFVTVEDDNAGFARWVEENTAWLIDCAAIEVAEYSSFTVYGEWVGPGIQKGTSLSQMPHKVFCPFMVSYKSLKENDDPYCDISWTWTGMKAFIREKHDIIILRPINFEGGSGHQYENYDFKNLPPYEHVSDHLIMVDFMNREKLSRFAEYINAIVAQIDTECPWTKQLYGVSGPGEGLVFYPYRKVVNVHGQATFDHNYMFDLENFSRWSFKAKGEKHQVVKNKAPVILDPEVVKAKSEFVEKFVTEGRLEQGYKMIALQEAAEPTMSDMSKFLKWMGNDILKECTAELEACGKDWKHFSGEVTKACAHWFKLRMATI